MCKKKYLYIYKYAYTGGSICTYFTCSPPFAKRNLKPPAFVGSLEGPFPDPAVFFAGKFPGSEIFFANSMRFHAWGLGVFQKQGCRFGPESSRQTLVSPIFRSLVVPSMALFLRIYRGQICNLEKLWVFWNGLRGSCPP